MSDKAKMLAEMIVEIARRPLYNDLDVGFRHSPLTNKEKLERYQFSCDAILQIALEIAQGDHERSKPKTE